jgi:hypothetical protein
MFQKEPEGEITPGITRFILQYKHFCRIRSPVVPTQHLKFHCDAEALVLPEWLSNWLFNKFANMKSHKFISQYAIIHHKVNVITICNYTNFKCKCTMKLTNYRKHWLRGFGQVKHSHRVFRFHWKHCCKPTPFVCFTVVAGVCLAMGRSPVQESYQTFGRIQSFRN